jgi:glutamate synthase domain-containing protein 2
MRQYFFEGEKDGMPFSRDRRAIVYQRAKNALDVRPFGTSTTSMRRLRMDGAFDRADAGQHGAVRIMIGGPELHQPYSASIFNISAMSFGALSANAIRALNGGAKLGGFYHDTGEGGYSPYHREGGGDIVWEIGSGYFGCRNATARSRREVRRGAPTAGQDGRAEAQPGRQAGPWRRAAGAKVSQEISLTRGVPMGEDCISPSRHSAFSTPVEMMQFIAEMRRLSGGKPAGFKLCIGHEWEFLAICKAMLETGHYPRLHRRRRQGGRHGRGAHGVRRPHRQADAPGPLLSCTTR